MCFCTEKHFDIVVPTLKLGRKIPEKTWTLINLKHSCITRKHRRVLFEEFYRKSDSEEIVALKLAHRPTFNATTRCGNMLQVFESVSKTYNIVA